MASNPATGELDPEDMNQLVTLIHAGDYPQLDAVARRMIERDPACGVAWKVLGVALARQQKDPLQALERAAQLLPQDPEAQCNLGNHLRGLKRLDEAAACHRRALALNPDYADAHFNLGSVLKEMGRLPEAAQSYGRAVELVPGSVAAHTLLAGTLRDLGKIEAAVAAFEQALALKPDSAELNHNLSVLLRLQHRLGDAAIHNRRALELNPTLVPALVFNAKLRADEGDFTGAEAQFRRAIEIDPSAAEAWSGIPAIKKMTSADGEWLMAARRLADQHPAPRKEMHLRYALGKYFDDVGEFAAAFDNYRRANELTKTFRPPHDRLKLSAFVDRVIECFDESAARRRFASADETAKPVFVIGMPRSGTTLAEQILASHPAVFGAGELPFWGLALAEHGPAALRELDADGLIARLVQAYLHLVDQLTQAPRVVDKMPSNFLATGLIHAALPNARFIHLSRNPLDTCLSIYFQDFEIAYSYANDLGDLAHAYAQYERLMQHWRRTLPDTALLDVPYEKLVADPMHWSRRMLEFVGLPWDPKTIEIQNTRRIISSASNWQARQAINASSVARWRNYASFIDPLLPLMAVTAIE
jgi:tetratricopeptide (TPR) repeat protein